MADVRLDPIPLADLRILADGAVPPGAAQALPDALPPPHVAMRARVHIERGKPAAWCATFYIRDAGGRIVGGCGFKDVADDRGDVEIGYAVAPGARGRGVATAAVGDLVALARRSGAARTLTACIDPGNAASRRVVERLGFRIDGFDDEGAVLWRLRLAGQDRASDA